MNTEINELKTLNNQSVNYKGIVKVSIVNGQNKTISTNTYYNNGTNNLFNFIANCIAGNYINHEKYRPCKIALYKAAATDIKSENRVSNFIFQDGAAKVKNISTGLTSGAIEPMLQNMKNDQGIRGYKVSKVANDKKALMTARIRIVPIEAVEDFDISLYLEDSLEGIIVSADETEVVEED